jgi:DNA-binding response OmpR family regulator
MIGMIPERSLPRGQLVQLRVTLWLDLEGGLLIYEHAQILLTAREVRMLAQLVHMMHVSRGYLSATALADVLGHGDREDREHCVEQAITRLRQKLGEVRYRPTLLRGRRGFGYRLFPEVNGADVHGAADRPAGTGPG